MSSDILIVSQSVADVLKIGSNPFSILSCLYCLICSFPHPFCLILLELQAPLDLCALLKIGDSIALSALLEPRTPLELCTLELYDSAFDFALFSNFTLYVILTLLS